MEKERDDNSTGKQTKQLFSKENSLKDYEESNLIEDGDSIKVKCSSCRKELVDIWIIMPDAPIVTEIVTECPHCGDKSFKHTVSGRYCLGHVESGVTKMTNTITETEMKGDICLQKILVKTSK